MAIALAAGPAAAAGTAVPRPRPPEGAPVPYAPQIRTPIRIQIAPFARPRNTDLPLRLDAHSRPATDRAQLGGAGKAAPFTRYKLEGVDVMGGGVLGTLDGRGARVVVQWPPPDED